MRQSIFKISIRLTSAIGQADYSSAQTPYTFACANEFGTDRFAGSNLLSNAAIRPQHRSCRNTHKSQKSRRRLTRKTGQATILRLYPKKTPAITLAREFGLKNFPDFSTKNPPRLTSQGLAAETDKGNPVFLLFIKWVTTFHFYVAALASRRRAVHHVNCTHLETIALLRQFDRPAHL